MRHSEGTDWTLSRDHFLASDLGTKKLVQQRIPALHRDTLKTRGNTNSARRRNRKYDRESVRERLMGRVGEVMGDLSEKETKLLRLGDPIQENKRPQEENKRPQEENKRPQEENKRPQEESKRPQGENKRLQEENKSPKKEDKRPKPGPIDPRERKIRYRPLKIPVKIPVKTVKNVPISSKTRIKKETNTIEKKSDHILHQRDTNTRFKTPERHRNQGETQARRPGKPRIPRQNPEEKPTWNKNREGRAMAGRKVPLRRPSKDGGARKKALLDLNRPFSLDRASHGIEAPKGFDSWTQRSPNRTRGVVPLAGVAAEGGEEGGAGFDKGATRNILLLDYSRPAYFPWRTTNDECANYATRFLVGGHARLIAMASFPGSGNTWLRYLAEALTGVFTGSVYHDEVLALKGLWGERDGYRQGTTLLQKTHSFPLLPEDVKDGLYRGGDFRFLLPPAGERRVVVLVRSPWEALVALRHYHAAGHTGFATPAFFTGTAWHNFTVERAELWVKLYTAWLSLPQTQTLVLHYEYLQHRLEQEALRLMSFLGVPLDYGRLECLLRYPEGRFRRPKYPKHLQGYTFPPEAAQVLHKGMRQVDELLINEGHTPLPTHLYSFMPVISKEREYTARPLVRAPSAGQ